MPNELKPKRTGNYRHTGRVIHGLYKKYPQLFNLYQTIKTRCTNPKRYNYKNYGGRGITLCDEWKEAKNFILWALSNGYKKGLQIDRIDNNKGYSPSNCRFVTNKENSNNRRNKKRITINGDCRPVSFWANKFKISPFTIYHWLRNYGEENTVTKMFIAWNKRS